MVIFFNAPIVVKTIPALHNFASCEHIKMPVSSEVKRKDSIPYVKQKSKASPFKWCIKTYYFLILSF